MFEHEPPIRQPPPERSAPPGLLLLGHGSDRGPEAAAPVRALAEALRGRGDFARVEVGFWKEPPFFREALEPFDEAAEVVVVPIFTSEGHYTRTVIPRELRLDGAGFEAGVAGGGAGGAVGGVAGRFATGTGRGSGGRRVVLRPPVGTHPGMLDIVLERAAGVLTGRDETTPCALVLVGHGTPRHPDSGRATEELAERAAERWPHGPVAPAFLDQEPRVPEVIEGLGAGEVVVVPFFIAAAWHAGVTLPASLGVEQGEGRLGPARIRYTAPVGTHPRLAEFVMEMARGGRAQRLP